MSSLYVFRHIVMKVIERKRNFGQGESLRLLFMRQIGKCDEEYHELHV